ncbi:MAG: hypothetical protein K2G53_02730 [Muribaculaceae bacterium]|nr:hypothetical protein [Bacteroidales bacterium]MBD5304442.1 hypothetical protein [Bacteroides sp.]MBD5340024.1 hypothetical protein [Bacteroides sp.]MDE6071450.1 hypothetical protein [Muribaculaceae bacterium]
MKKTYGVNGMMEWNALFTAGRTTVRVHFTGGTVTGYGVSPATFTTDNPAVIHIIEHSDWFRHRKILLLKTEGGKR